MILAYDLASTTGVARGVPGAAPYTWSFEVAGGHPAKFAQMARAVGGHLKQWSPSLVVIEAPFVGKNANAAKLLYGFRGVVYGICALRSVPVEEYAPGDIRKHFIGNGGLKRSEAKAQVQARCHVLGWPVRGEDEADAAALFDYAACLASPEHGKRFMELGDGR